MKLNWKWLFGIILILILLIAPSFMWHLIMPIYGYGMMGGGYGYSYRMMPFGMLFMWLIPPGTLILIGLGVICLVKKINSKSL